MKILLILLNILKKCYLYIFGRPSMQKYNRIIYNLALHGFGYNNYSSLKNSGELKFLTTVLNYKPNLCIDIGANKGNFSKFILQNSVNCKVIAFEPLPKCYEKLLILKEQYPERFTPINMGVADIESILELNFGDENSELASFSKEINKISYVGVNNINKVNIEVISLDKYFSTICVESIDLIKIDTEGFEYEVLKGASETILKFKPKFIQIEFNWHQLFKNVTLYQISLLLPNYKTYQLLPYGEGLIERDILEPESNIFQFSNFVFVRKDITL